MQYLWRFQERESPRQYYQFHPPILLQFFVRVFRPYEHVQHKQRLHQLLSLGVQNKRTQKYKDLTPHYRHIVANKARHQTSHKRLHQGQYREQSQNPQYLKQLFQRQTYTQFCHFLLVYPTPKDEYQKDHETQPCHAQ